MPYAAPTFRPNRAQTKRERNRDYDQARRRHQPWRNWYKRIEWLTIRQRELSSHPYCRRCALKDLVVLATVVNHIEPHRGDWQKFIAGPFESLCKHCHDSVVQSEERSNSNDGRGH